MSPKVLFHLLYAPKVLIISDACYVPWSFSFLFTAFQILLHVLGIYQGFKFHHIFSFTKDSNVTTFVKVLQSIQTLLHLLRLYKEFQVLSHLLRIYQWFKFCHIYYGVARDFCVDIYAFISSVSEEKNLLCRNTKMWYLLVVCYVKLWVAHIVWCWVIM